MKASPALLRKYKKNSLENKEAIKDSFIPNLSPLGIVREIQNKLLYEQNLNKQKELKQLKIIASKQLKEARRKRKMVQLNLNF